MPRMNDNPNPNVEASPFDDWEMPQDMDEFRFDLARRINRYVANHLGCWERCDERECRRARASRSPQIACPISPPPPVLTPEEDAQCRAEFYDAIKARMAEIEQAGDDGIDQQS
ncbi:MAG TPA: hypothetical protein VNR39_07840 [Pseudolabrys sp.]|nr:hypothetical protein [Pseudolabrys sp.]